MNTTLKDILEGYDEQKFIARFWSKVTKGSLNDCWLWRGKKRGGYGRIRVWRDGREYSAHRISLLLTKGTLSELDVCHTCDNPPCVNPEHLFAGTEALNMADAANKNRMALGLNNGRAKLSNEQVMKIRNAEFTSRHAAFVLAKQFGISKTHVHSIRRNERRNKMIE